MTSSALVRDWRTYSKKDHLAASMVKVGLVALLELLPSKPQLIVLNYHRIGDRNQTLFDPGVFSTDTSGLDEQIRFLKKRYKFATPLQALAIIEGREQLTETLLLMTFDDGYRDNFTEAMPVLKLHGIEAIFFLVTSYIDEKTVPWWDQIAFLAKQHAPKALTIHYPYDETFDLSPAQFKAELRRLLRVFKSPQVTEPERFLAELEQQVGIRVKDITADLMMTWDDARIMQDHGMVMGLHTHTHRLLSKLTPAEQAAELSQCKAILERELGEEAVFLAYPVGAKDAYNQNTLTIAKNMGIRAAFSFHGGANLWGHINPFDVKRVAFENYGSLARVRLALALMAVTGKIWF